ncbi:MAG: hypothetical protein ACI4XL_11005 [Bacillus sp. (in: firmicutes)]
MSGSAGFLLALLLLIACIVGVAARNSKGGVLPQVSSMSLEALSESQTSEPTQI